MKPQLDVLMDQYATVKKAQATCRKAIASCKEIHTELKVDQEKEISFEALPLMEQELIGQIKDILFQRYQRTLR